jgi:biopolymer transport protein ExbD
MKLKRTNHDKVEVATSSLNDIMFFLLLFFLIVATFANPNVIKLMLPTAQTSQAMNKKQITLSITKEKRYYIDTREVRFEDLYNRLLAIKDALPDATIIVRTDATLTVQDLVDVLEMGNDLSLKMILATQKRK